MMETDLRVGERVAAAARAAPARPAAGAGERAIDRAVERRNVLPRVFIVGPDAAGDGVAVQVQHDAVGAIEALRRRATVHVARDVVRAWGQRGVGFVAQADGAGAVLPAREFGVSSQLVGLAAGI